jgi:hypothetical protein
MLSLSRIFSRQKRRSTFVATTCNQDEAAIERYEYLLRTGSPAAIERSHFAGFARLTSQQRNLLFTQLTRNAESPEELPADAAPDSLARAATLAELKRPGSLPRAFGTGYGGHSFGGRLGSTMLGTVAGYVVASAILYGLEGQDDLTTAQTSAPVERGYGGDHDDFDRNVIDSSAFDFPW